METLIARTLFVEAPASGRDAAPAPAFAVAYNGRAISDAIAPLLLSLTYTDKSAGEADELEVEIEDSAGNWRRLWYPEKGARLVARVGYPGNLLPCGEFEIDEVAQAGPPSVVTLRGLAAGLSKAVRTKRSKAFENQTLAQIAGHFATAHGLTVAGKIRPITIQRVTQSASRDLKFLKKLALEYGYVFSLRGRQLVFTDVYALEGTPAVLTLQEKDVVSYSFTDKLTQTFAAAEVQYHNPKTRKTVRHRHAAGPGSTAADTLKIRRKSEDVAQAAAQAKAALHWRNSRATECAITLPGNPLVVAGSVIRLAAEFGTVAGTYYVLASTHKLSRSDGYETSFTAKKTGR